MSKLEGLPTIHYISLEESIGRRTNLENWFKQYNITNYVPHLFKRFEEYEYELVGSHVHLLNQHAKGPITSHLSVLREIYETYDDECFLIFEDDVSLKTIEHWNFSWKEFYKNLPKNWNCIQLIVIREYDCKEYIFEKRKGCDWCAAAYLIRRKYLKNLLELYYPSKNLTFNLDTHFLPKIENLLFANHHDGGADITENEIYSFPLFLEDCYTTKTTLDVDYDLEHNGIRSNHCRSHDDVLNWWKNKGKFLRINQIMNNTIDRITEQSELFDFSLDTENAQKNYNLAKWYEQQGHTAPAHTYYLRAAERSDNDLLAYAALLRASSCYKSQGSRPATEKILLENALNLLPSRPEAYYFLSLFYERKSEWQNAYTYANLGLECYKQEIKNIDVPGYLGKYLLTFQKAVAAWWWGKSSESRKLFRFLVDEQWDQIDQKHRDLIEDNITRLGSGPESQAFHTYKKEEYSKLRFKFDNSSSIERNYSQVYQDMFILSMLNGKKNGTFLEIGGADPFKGNNTALLEKKFEWKGVSIEYNEKFIQHYKSNRTAKLLHTDALKIDYENILSENFEGNCIDYLQLDIEPARKTYECMLKIPFDKYKFAVITYEHDYYVDVTKSYREKSREFLTDKGYVLVVNDISPDGESNFEDWWVHPDLVDPVIMDKMKSVIDGVHHCKKYILPETERDEDIVESSVSNIPNEKMEMNFYNINPVSKQTSWIVDNFYENPDKVREFALNQDYHIGGIGRGYIGNRTHQQFLFPGLKERFEEIMGQKITKWEEHGMNGRFQYCWAGQPLVYHCDSQRWGGMLYLTPGAPYQCGTTLYAHKQTRARTYYDEGWDVAWKDIPGDPHLDGTSFEPVDVLGNVYNRLVIFDASCIHSASEYFGTVQENARLWQMFFFDT